LGAWDRVREGYDLLAVVGKGEVSERARRRRGFGRRYMMANIHVLRTWKVFQGRRQMTTLKFLQPTR
jgi:hypothetical protein